MTKGKKTLAVALVSLAVQFTNVNALRTCSKIDAPIDVINIINEKKNKIVLVCPFNINSSEAIDITRSNVSIVCLKEKASDKCEFTGINRHLNILADSVTLVGFDFNKSKSGAVQVAGSSISFIDCSFKA